MLSKGQIAAQMYLDGKSMAVICRTLHIKKKDRLDVVPNPPDLNKGTVGLVLGVITGAALTVGIAAAVDQTTE